MNLNDRNGNTKRGLLTQISFAALIMFCLTAFASAQTESVAQNNSAAEAKTAEKKVVLLPMVNELKGIKIGMTADEVKDKLGKAEVADDGGFYYIFSDEESMRITLDGDKKVRMIAAIYNGEETKAPKYEDVFGADMALEKQPDGKIYKLVQYPDAGFWVAYNRIMVSEKPMVTVTMQKLQ